MSPFDASILVKPPQSPAQARTYAARLAKARKRLASIEGNPVDVLDLELRALKQIARALMELPPTVRHRVLGLASGYLNGGGER